MQPKFLTPEEITLRDQEDRYVQEGKKDYERVDRARSVAAARKARLSETEPVL